MTPQTTGVPSQRVPTESGTPPTGADRTDDLSSASTGELVQRLSAQLSELVRRELDLARTELATKGKRAGAGAGLAGAGGVVALYGVGALIASAIAGLATVLPVWLSALIVGVVLLLVAGVLALVGRSRLREATPPVPEQAVRGVQDDVAAVKNAVHR
jgi:MFS family permease